MELEESLRRLARSLHGGLTHKRARRRAAAGSTRAARCAATCASTASRSRPVTVRRAEDKPRLVVLTDVSLSVRATARFTLHLVHGLQNLFGQVRTFAFVAELVEVTDLFEDHPVEQALGLVFGGDVLDVDANSDYGAAFGTFHEDFGSAVTRRTTVLVLGDGRGNGNDPNLAAFEEITRRARETIWLTPEPRYSWGLGGCDLPGVRRVLQPGARGARPDRAGERGEGDGDRARRPMTPRLWLDPDGRVRHRIGPDEISNDLAGWIADDLVAPGLLDPAAFERRSWRSCATSTPAGRRSTATPSPHWRPAEPGGTNAGMAPVHDRAAALARRPDVVELGCCFGFLSLRLAAAGHRVTAVDLVPGTARLLATDVADARARRSRPWPATRRRIPLATGAADTVFAVHLLEHLPRGADAGVLAEMLRVARRRVVVAVPFEDEPNPAWGHVRTFDLAELDALGAATGLPYTVDEHHGGWLVVDPGERSVAAQLPHVLHQQREAGRREQPRQHQVPARQQRDDQPGHGRDPQHQRPEHRRERQHPAPPDRLDHAEHHQEREEAGEHRDRRPHEQPAQSEDQHRRAHRRPHPQEAGAQVRRRGVGQVRVAQVRVGRPGVARAGKVGGVRGALLGQRGAARHERGQRPFPARRLGDPLPAQRPGVRGGAERAGLRGQPADGRPLRR